MRGPDMDQAYLCALRLSWASVRTRGELHRLNASRNAPVVCIQAVCLHPCQNGRRTAVTHGHYEHPPTSARRLTPA